MWNLSPQIFTQVSSTCRNQTSTRQKPYTQLVGNFLKLCHYNTESKNLLALHSQTQDTEEVVQQEHVFFISPAFLSSMSSTVCPVLPITNNFWATEPAVGTQGKPQEPQRTKHPSRTRCGGMAVATHRDTLRSAFLRQWEVKRDRRPRDRQRYRPYPRSLLPPCTHRECPKSLQLLWGLDFVCQQPRGE